MEHVPNNNIVDMRLKQLVEMGKIEKTYNFLERMNNEYWDKFISLCDDDIVDYVLSYPQPNNWSGWLYAACEKRRGLKPNR